MSQNLESSQSAIVSYSQLQQNFASKPVGLATVVITSKIMPHTFSLKRLRISEETFVYLLIALRFSILLKFCDIQKYSKPFLFLNYRMDFKSETWVIIIDIQNIITIFARNLY